MSCNLCYHGAFWTRRRERLPSACMFADWLASVHMHEFKPSLVTMLPVSFFTQAAGRFGDVIVALASIGVT